MSEFQLSLLTIGLIVVAGVYGYGLWQQWRYRRSQAELSNPEVITPSGQTPPVPARAWDALPGEVVEAMAEPGVGVDAGGANEVCGLLNENTDYVATFELEAPHTAGALDALWQRRFDFGKSVHACGLNAATGLWERLIPESKETYRTFRIGLQLVDRSGAVSEARLAAFRDLLGQLAARLQIEVRLPSVEEVLQRAQTLDRFCADVDRMIGINLLAGGGKKLFGTEVASAAQRLGMSLQADGSFHRQDESGATLFSLGAADGTAFHHHTLNQSRVDSLTLLLDIPRAAEPVRCFDEMARHARELAKMLRMTMADDQRVALGDGSIAQIREQVAATRDLMVAGDIAPGSPQALRLFS